MLRSIWNSMSGLNSNQNKIDIISNNIANINTNGYKKIDVNFSDIMKENIDRLGVPVINNDKDKYVGSGCRISGFITNNLQGALEETNNNLDLAIEGIGYFKLIDKEGNFVYTRNGSFHIDSENNIVDSMGNKLEIILNENASEEIIDYNNINIKEDGSIIYNDKQIGKINLYSFISDDDLYPIGNSLFKGKNPQLIDSKIKQGYIEKSNVDIAKELTDLLVTQRAFEFNSRALKSSEEMWQITNNLRAK
ncbi:flagellar hook-basal body complex protein [Thermobrachium celere]|uniref:flagellar hook-basal body complex protein n=1 Tax=Thermobrachium celere TaxID=53422 RepID=UPI001942B73D|nr:flagellar hook-basal body complex protein [Thermobrachium celere]GFR35578.1 flagellar basal body protein [Thermobrachium celere]